MVVAFIGDIVGRPARKIIGEFLPKVRRWVWYRFSYWKLWECKSWIWINTKKCKGVILIWNCIMSGGNHSFDKRGDSELFDKYPLIRSYKVSRIGLFGQGGNLGWFWGGKKGYRFLKGRGNFFQWAHFPENPFFKGFQRGVLKLGFKA